MLGSCRADLVRSPVVTGKVEGKDSIARQSYSAGSMQVRIFRRKYCSSRKP
jgi:hypothetical protein